MCLWYHQGMFLKEAYIPRSQRICPPVDHSLVRPHTFLRRSAPYPSSCNQSPNRTNHVLEILHPPPSPFVVVKILFKSLICLVCHLG